MYVSACACLCVRCVVAVWFLSDLCLVSLMFLFCFFADYIFLLCVSVLLLFSVFVAFVCLLE